MKRGEKRYHLTWEQGVVGSNPAVPTIPFPMHRGGFVPSIVQVTFRKIFRNACRGAPPLLAGSASQKDRHERRPSHSSHNHFNGPAGITFPLGRRIACKHWKNALRSQ